jgi:AcrR family transcriptional regulator
MSMPTSRKQGNIITTEQKILCAAEELLNNGDAQNVTVKNILRLSGVSVESFSAGFRDVEGLFKELHEKLLKSVKLEELDKGVNEPDLRSGLRHVCQILLEFAYQERKLIAYFITHPSQGSLFTRQIGVDSILKILQAHQDEVPQRDLKTASEDTARLIYYMIFGIAFLMPRDFISRENTIRNSVESTTQWAYSYLTTEEP